MFDNRVLGEVLNPMIACSVNIKCEVVELWF